MGITDSVAQHWFEAIQTVGIVAGFCFTAYTFRTDEKARKIANLIAINHQYGDIWKEVYERPKLSRVMEPSVDLAKEPISVEERLFVNLLILHLNTVYRAMGEGMFVTVEGLKADIQKFFSRPIPADVWQNAKSLQDADFVAFIDACLNPR